MQTITATGNADVILTAEDDIRDSDSNDGNLLAADDLNATAKSRTADGPDGLILDTTVASATIAVGNGANDGDVDIDETDAVIL